MDLVFPGLRAMENFHPVVVHFPIVLLPLALLFQVLALRRGNDWQRVALLFLWLGTLGALAAATTGLLAEAGVEHQEAAHEVMELHKTLMLTTTGLGALLSMLALVCRRRLTCGVQLLLLGGLLVLSGVLTVGADRGGQLVFQYGVGVQKPAVEPTPGGAQPPVPEHKNNHEH